VRTRALALGAAALLATISFISPSPASAIDTVNTKKLRKAVTVSGILRHERALQRIANQNDGTRASGTPGYQASVDYVVRKMTKAGYDVKTQEFTFPFYRDLAAPELTVAGTSYETATFQYSGSGDVTGPVISVLDNQIPPGSDPSSSNAGCEAADFPAAPAEPAIALIQRGTCTFEIKADNALAAGYEAVIIFNEGQVGRQELLTGTLSNPKSIPIVGLSFEDGAKLYAATQAGPVEGTVFTSTETDLEAKTYNVIADSPTGRNPDEVVVVGAHLDSVVEGPGINDNGSGSATILEIAEELQELKYLKRNRLQRQVRFIFFGAEEAGLLGSDYYVKNLEENDEAELERIYANLNFDMLGSPNYARLVYDGDGSATTEEPDEPDDAGPPGSEAIEKIFTDYFESQGLATEPTAFDGRSDYGPFIAEGIPAGGLFSGAEDIKTVEQVALYGGTAGVAFDKCYHQACDTINNLNTKALSELGDAAAHATLVLARSKTGLYPDGSLVAKQKAHKVAAAKDYKGHAAVR